MNIKDKKGSIALFVMIGMVFMASFLLISYANNLNKSKYTKEQYDMLNTIYDTNKSDGEIYNTIYADLREKNKEIKIEEFDRLEEEGIILDNTFEDTLKNYRIYYGGVAFEENKILTIKVSNGDRSKSKTYTVELPLELIRESGYLDYKTQSIRENKVVDDGKIKGMVELPTINTYEGQTRIEILHGPAPYKILVEYTRYEVN